MGEPNQHPENASHEESQQPKYIKDNDHLPEEIYHDLPFEPIGVPIQETTMGRYMREHRLLNSMLMSLLILLILLWGLWDLIIFAAIGSPDGTDFTAANALPSQPKNVEQNIKLRDRQHSTSHRVTFSFTPKKPSDIPIEDGIKLNAEKILPPTGGIPETGFDNIGAFKEAGEILGDLDWGLPKEIEARCDPKTRINRLISKGGTHDTEKAIKRGLDWLKANQSEDGSWGAMDKNAAGNATQMDKNAATGMALLCFLGHCELTNSQAYGATVLKAIKFLTSDSNPPEDQNIGQGNRGCYSHPIRTYALCEAYTMTKIKALEGYARRAAEFVVKGQHEDGGWAYGYDKGPTAHVDLSVTGWNVQALKAAILTGIKIDGLDEAMDKAIAYTKRCQAKDGKFAYKEGSGGKVSLTGTGVLCLQLWKNASSPEATKGLEWIVNNLATEWSTVNVYEWYYHAQACFQANGVSGGPKYWKAWNKDFQGIVIDAQASDGHWPHGAHFHGDSDIYRTTMTILMLEVYYRYAPVGGGKTYSDLRN